MEALQTQVGGDHYKSMAIQPLEFCLRNRIPFAEGNIIKYVCRFRDKGGKEDLKKALHYLEALIEAEYPPTGEEAFRKAASAIFLRGE